MIKKQLKLLNSQKRSRHEFISSNLVFSLRVRNESRIYECGNGGPYGWQNRDHLQIIEPQHNASKCLRNINIELPVMYKVFRVRVSLY